VSSAKGRQISYRRILPAGGIDVSAVSFNVCTLSNAVEVRPSLVWLEFARASREAVHRWKIEVMPAAKIVEIYDRRGAARGIPESAPDSANASPRRGYVQIDVETDSRVSAPRELNPGLLALQYLTLFSVFEDGEFKASFAVQLPSGL
jgi:hypothetical protein